MSIPWTITAKDLAPVVKHHPPINPPIGTFSPPGPVTVSFGAVDLFKSIARCSATSRATPSLVAALVASSRALIEFLVEDTTSTVAFLEEVTDLVDAERTALSGRVGAGVTDQTMEMMGYIWRDVAEELIDSMGKKLADYVYENAAGQLVLAEAKGSITTSASQAGSNIRALKAYKLQVDPYVYIYPRGARGHPSVGLISHGYAVAFSALPGPIGSPTAVIPADAFLAIAETQITGSSSASGVDTTGADQGLTDQAPDKGQEPPSYPLRLGNYRGVFLLANAPNVVAVIEALLSQAIVEEATQTFRLYRCSDRLFLIGSGPTYEAVDRLPVFLDGWLFAIELQSAEEFLGRLVNSWMKGAMTILPLVRAAGGQPPPPYLLSPDGFAMIRQVDAKFLQDVTWHSTAGFYNVPSYPDANLTSSPL